MKPPRCQLVLFVACLFGCPAEVERSDGRRAKASRPAPSTPRLTFGGKRPVELHRPPKPTSAPLPLLLALHGLGGEGERTAETLGLRALVDKVPLLLLAPDGTLDSRGRRFWNAGSCCDFEGRGVDDLSYLRRLLADVRAAHQVDPRRIYVVGYSNGGHMAHRVGCALHGQIAAVVSIAGVAFDNPPCTPKSPVSVLQIHDPGDPVVPYQPARRRRPAGVVAYPGATGSVQIWARRNGCLAGVARVVKTEGPVRFESLGGCPPGGVVGLWAVDGVGHAAYRMPDFTRRVWRWLKAHPKVEP